MLAFLLCLRLLKIVTNRAHSQCSQGVIAEYDVYHAGLLDVIDAWTYGWAYGLHAWSTGVPASRALAPSDEPHGPPAMAPSITDTRMQTEALQSHAHSIHQQSHTSSQQLRQYSTVHAGIAKQQQRKGSLPVTMMPFDAPAIIQSDARVDAALSSALDVLRSVSNGYLPAHQADCSGPHQAMSVADAAPVGAATSNSRLMDPASCEPKQVTSMYGSQALAARQLHLQALASLQAKNWQGAAELLFKAVQLHEVDAGLHHSLAKVRGLQGLYHQALEHASRAVELQPERRAHWLLRAYCRSKAGFHELALAELAALAAPGSPGSPEEKRQAMKPFDLQNTPPAEGKHVNNWEATIIPGRISGLFIYALLVVHSSPT